MENQGKATKFTVFFFSWTSTQSEQKLFAKMDKQHSNQGKTVSFSYGMTSMLPEIIQDIDQKSFAEMEIEEPHPNWSKTVCFNYGMTSMLTKQFKSNFLI